MGRFLSKDKSKTQWRIGFWAAFFCCAFFAALLSFRTMPVSEGWYTEYAWQINHGNLPYRDFEYLFFPLYLFVISFYTRIFGYSILALRILGVVVFGCIGGALYCIFAKIFDNFSALIASVASAFYLQSEVAQVFYDYIRFHDLFAFLATYVLICVTIDCKDGVEKDKRSSTFFVKYLFPVAMLTSGLLALFKSFAGGIHTAQLIISVCILIFFIGYVLIQRFAAQVNIINGDGGFLPILCGLLIACECMIKQSNGMLMIAFGAIYLLYCSVVLKNKRFYNAFVGYFTGVVFCFAILLIYLSVTDSVSAFWNSCFSNALAAKGGAMKSLFGWIPSNLKFLWNKRTLILVLGLVLCITVEPMIRLKTKRRKTVSSGFIVSYAVVACVVCYVLTISESLANRFYAKYDSFIPFAAFFVPAFAFIVFGFYLLYCFAVKKEMHDIINQYFAGFAVLGVIVTQGFGSGMSGGLGTSQTAIGLGFLIAICVHTAICSNKKVLLAAVCIYSLFIGGTFTSRKTLVPYYWWGLTQAPLSQHTEIIDVPTLKGIRVSPTDKVVYETVYNDVIRLTEPEDKIFVFPQCPIFYAITDRHSETYSKVQWFDVSSQSTILSDIETLRENPPSIVVYLSMPDSVYEGHETLFSTYQTRTMRDFLLSELIPNYGYYFVDRVDVCEGFTLDVYSKIE